MQQPVEEQSTRRFCILRMQRVPVPDSLRVDALTIVLGREKKEEKKKKREKRKKKDVKRRGDRSEHRNYARSVSDRITGTR